MCLHANHLSPPPLLLSQLEDPTSSFTETIGSELVLVVSRFAAGIGGLYVIYFVILLVLAFNRFKSMTASTRYLLGVSITTLILVLVGFFAQSFSAQYGTTILFLAGYGVPNIYLWSLMILFRPAPFPEGWTANTMGVFGGGSDDGSGGAASSEADVADAAITITTPEAWSLLPPQAQYEAYTTLQMRLRSSGLRRAAYAGGQGSGGGGAIAVPPPPMSEGSYEVPPPASEAASGWGRGRAHAGKGLTIRDNGSSAPPGAAADTGAAREEGDGGVTAVRAVRVSFTDAGASAQGDGALPGGNPEEAAQEEDAGGGGNAPTWR